MAHHPSFEVGDIDGTISNALNEAMACGRGVKLLILP